MVSDIEEIYHFIYFDRQKFTSRFLVHYTNIHNGKGIMGNKMLKPMNAILVTSKSHALGEISDTIGLNYATIRFKT